MVDAVVATKLVVVANVAVKLVVDATVADKLVTVVVASVEVPVTPSVPATVWLPNTVEVPTYDDDAYELTENTLRNLLANVPNERTPVVVGNISAARLSVLKNDD